MKRVGLKILIIGLTALGLSAGVLAGMLVSRLPGTAGQEKSSASPRPAIPTPLVEELDLTPQQQEQMRTIWEGVRGRVQDCFQRAQNMQKQRDDEIVKLMTDEQKLKFEKIAQKFHDLDVKITADRQQIFDEAINETRQLLTDEQRRKYDQILKARLGRVPTTGPVAAVFGLLDQPELLDQFWFAGGIHD